MSNVNMTKNSNIAHVKAIKGSDFFYKWLGFIKPLHGLTKLEMRVLSLILAKRQELLSLIKDEAIMNQVLRSSQTRKEIREQMDMTSTQFNILYSNLKKSGAINEDRIVNKYIPNVESSSGEYRLILIFDINEKPTVDLQS